MPLLLALLAGLAGASSRHHAPARPLAPASPIDRSDWVTTDDYPADGLTYRMQGKVEFTLDADVEGKVVGCAVTKSSGYALLDETTCRLMKERAHYRIQRDEHSNPIPFVIRSAMNWRLPTADEGHEHEVRFATGAGGGTACIADFDRIDVTLPDRTCAQIIAAARIQGAPLDTPATVWLPDALAPRP